MTRVRFAPSPTGYLHIGNARTVLFNWLFARATSGKFILRVEDTDVIRSKKIYFDKILKDLQWLGLDWDEGPDKGGPFAPYRQSARIDIYRKFAQRLVDEKKAYRCFCSNRELKQRRQEALRKGLSTKYDNRCRRLTPEEIERFKKRKRISALRFKVPEKKLIIRDLVKGQVEFDTSFVGDFVIMKSNGTPSFNFANVCDDYAMKISHVIRGEDHLSNTPKHVLLYEALGATPPEFAHMSLTTGRGGVRLSKRTGAASIARYRELGYLPEALVNYLALLGWSPGDDKEVVSLDEMMREFKLEKLSRSSEAIDPDKLNWISGIYIRNADLDRLTRLAIPYLVKKKLVTEESAKDRFEEIKRIVSLVRGHLNCVSEITDHAKVFFKEKIKISDKEKKDLIRSDNAQSVLKSFLKNIDSIGELNPESFSALMNGIKADTSLKGKELYMPVRVAITGQLHGPELSLILPILGKARCVARVKRGLKIR